MNKFISNFGTTLKIKVGSAYTKIKGVYIVPAIEKSQEKLEVTHHDQEGNQRQFIPSGLEDPGDYGFDMRSMRSDPTQQALYALYKSGEAGDFQICHPDGLTESFPAYVVGMTYNEADAESPEPVQLHVDLAFAGEITEEIESL